MSYHLKNKIRLKSKYCINIEKIGFGGDGIGTLQGMPVFVNEVIPGEKCLIEIESIKDNFLNARLLKVIDASPYRKEPECNYFGECGGCNFQNIEYEYQLKIKKEIVEDCVKKIVGISNLNIEDIEMSKMKLGYRSRMEFSFSTNDSKKIILGLHKKKDENEIIEINRCPLQTELANKVLLNCSRYFASSKHTIYNPSKKIGNLSHLTIRTGINTGEIMIIIHTFTNKFLDRNLFLKYLLSRIKGIKTVVWRINKQVGDRAICKAEKVIFGPSFLKEKLCELTFNLSPASFLQSNVEQAEKLYNYVVDNCSPKKSDIVFDLYSGAGPISLILSKFVKQIFGIELNESAVKDSIRNARLNNVKNVYFFQGRVEDKLNEIKDKLPNTIIVNPPRSGISTKALKAIISTNAEKIVYISCNPPDLARDLKIFVENNYKIKKIKPFDMFPQTHHIECVAILEKD